MWADTFQGGTVDPYYRVGREVRIMRGFILRYQTYVSVLNALTSQT